MALEWKLDFLRIALPEQIEKLRSIVGGLCDNVIVEVEEFSRNLADSLREAVPTARTGQQVKLAFTLKLTVPEQSEFQPELNRILALIQRGGLREK